MANHFPAVPAALNLASLTYSAAIQQTGQDWPSAGFTFTGVTAGGVAFAASQAQTGVFTITFNFTVPGNPGSFDQDTAEAQVVSVLNNLAQAVATTGGLTLAQVQAMTAVTRIWTWTDSTGTFTLVNDTDKMPYPPV